MRTIPLVLLLFASCTPASRVPTEPMQIPTPVSTTAEPSKQLIEAACTREKKVHQEIFSGKNRPVVASGVLYIAAIGDSATLPVKVLTILDLELPPGEAITGAYTGDSERFKVDVGTSGKDTPHLFLKATEPGTSTNLVVTTTGRTYHINLKATDAATTKRVKFYFPEECKMLMDQAKKAKEQPKPQRVARDCSYSVSGPYSAWRPQRVCNDGSHTYIELPDRVRTGKLPVLLVRDEGEDEVTNYDFKGRTFTVPGVFEEAVLLRGAGSAQQRIIIRKVP